MKAEQVSDKYKSKRSGILYIVTGLVVAVFVIFSLVTLVVVNSSMDRMIENSKDKIIMSEVENISSATDYITDMLMPVFNQKAQELTVNELLGALVAGHLTEPQRWMNGEMAELADRRVLGLEKVLAVMAGSPFSSRPVILAASEEPLLAWEMPEYLVRGMAEDQAFLLMEEGIPELGLEGEHLIVLKKTQDETRGITAFFIGVSSLQEKVDEIDAFYSTEQRRARLLMGLVVGISVVVIVMITFFVLSFLLRRRITEPINELSAAAERVMEGDLEVAVPVRDGEELEKLKTVFNEMVHSIREVINKSMGL